MFEFTRYYGRRRIRGSAALTGGLAVLTGLFLYMFPSISQGVDLDEYVDSIPPALREAFGIEALGTIEGFLAAELYSFGWVLLLGLYLAYAAASLIADDVEDGRLDVLLALPVSRSKLLLERFAALLVPIVVVNVGVFVVVLVGTAAVGEPVAVGDLAMVHLLSVPYLLTTAAIGLAASVSFDRGGLAQRAAMGVVFGLFLVDSVVSSTDFAWIGGVSPTRYYEPSAVLVRAEWDLLGAGVLLLAATVLVAASREYFRRKDVA
jgi:ABC-2 type transport system permease protein